MSTKLQPEYRLSNYIAEALELRGYAAAVGRVNVRADIGSLTYPSTRHQSGVIRPHQRKLSYWR